MGKGYSDVAPARSCSVVLLSSVAIGRLVAAATGVVAGVIGRQRAMGSSATLAELGSDRIGAFRSTLYAVAAVGNGGRHSRGERWVVAGGDGRGKLDRSRRSLRYSSAPGLLLLVCFLGDCGTAGSCAVGDRTLFRNTL